MYIISSPPVNLYVISRLFHFLTFLFILFSSFFLSPIVILLYFLSLSLSLSPSLSLSLSVCFFLTHTHTLCLFLSIYLVFLSSSLSDPSPTLCTTSKNRSQVYFGRNYYLDKPLSMFLTIPWNHINCWYMRGTQFWVRKGRQR